jgi:hypothetical protein
MAAASMPSMEGTGMAGLGTPPGRAATTAAAAAVAGTEVAMAPATAAAMAEGVAAAVAAGIERSCQSPPEFCVSRVRSFFIFLYISSHKYQSVGRNCNGNTPRI